MFYSIRLATEGGPPMQWDRTDLQPNFILFLVYSRGLELSDPFQPLWADSAVCGFIEDMWYSSRLRARLWGVLPLRQLFRQLTKYVRSISHECYYVKTRQSCRSIAFTANIFPKSDQLRLHIEAVKTPLNVKSPRLANVPSRWYLSPIDGSLE